MDKHRILIVDDSPSELRILMELLKNDYAVFVSTSGVQAIEMVKTDPSIELVLLDVMMPVKNGYDTCKEMLEISPNLPIVFVSSNDSTEEILTGFDVGGVDYLTKPIDTSVVSRKVDVILSERSKIVELQSENENTSEMVMNVIVSAGHLGTVLGFLRAGLKIKTHEGLLNSLFDVFDSLNIDACVELRTPKRSFTQSTSGTITPLELDLLARAGDMSGRFLERGTRYIVNFDTVSVIIKNMPVDDAMSLGDLRDNLMMIIEDTNGLNEKLCAEQEVNTVSASAGADVSGDNKDVLLDIASTLDMAANFQERQKSEMMNLVEDMSFKFEQCFFKLGLLEQQEEMLSEIVTAQASLFTGHIEQSLEMEDALFGIQKQIRTLVGNTK
ncbi:MAG: response regulator [Glaciecola sp.]